MVLNPAYNDLIKHLLRAPKLPSLDEVCAQIQKEQGSLGLFGGKGEIVLANKSAYKPEDKKSTNCEHCKRKGHSKDKCWILHPHLKPAKFNKDAKAHFTEAVGNQGGQGQSDGNHGSQGQADGNALAMVAYNGAGGGHGGASSSGNEFVRKSDLEALLKSIASLKESGITFLSSRPRKALVIDSGASHHMISNPDLLSNIRPALGCVEIANGDKVAVSGIGDLKLFDKNSKALYMPKFTSNLLSVKKATTDLNCYAIFGPNHVQFQDIESMKLLGKGGTRDDLYVLENTSPSNNVQPISVASCFSVNLNKLWHARLGHPHVRAFQLLLPKFSFDHSKCEACILGKHCRTVFPKSETLYANCFDLVHSDVWTSPCQSRDRNKYFVTFIDEKSKYTWVTLLQSKDRVFDAFLCFQNYVTNQFNAKIKILRTDNGGEYVSMRFKEHLSKHGIMHQTSCPYTPQQNGVAERKNRHLMDVARAMMFEANVPKRFWGDAVVTACYLINRIPTRILGELSPFEVLHKTKPSIEHLKVFGCVCFVLSSGEQRNKLDPRSLRCMFIGYSPTQKGYKCFDPVRNRVHVSRDVKFLEEQGYYGEKDTDGLEELARSPSGIASSLRHLLNHLGNPEPPMRTTHPGLRTQ